MNKTKILKLVLILSLAANAVLLLGSAAGIFSLGKASAVNARDTATASKSKSAPTDKTLSPEAAKAAAALLSTDDPAALRDKLRAMGLSDAVVRAVVTARIKSRDAARLREIDDAAVAVARKTPFWHFRDVGLYPFGHTKEQLREQTKIASAEQRQLRQVLGSADIKDDLAQAAYGAFLPANKVSRLFDIKDDYNELRSQIHEKMMGMTGGFQMPGDQTSLKLLEDEQRRDIQALLTPEEQAAMKLRDSYTASILQQRLYAFDSTEEEYKAIFALRNPVDEKYQAALAQLDYNDPNRQNLYREQDAALKQIDAQIKDMLGDERYAEYQRAQRPDYQTLVLAARRFDLAPETVSQTYQVRETTVNEAVRISNDASLDADQKTQAYAALAGQATAQIRASLGDEIGDAYINNALPWLKQLPQGGTVGIFPDGSTVFVTPPRAANVGKAGKRK